MTRLLLLAMLSCAPAPDPQVYKCHWAQMCDGVGSEGDWQPLCATQERINYEGEDLGARCSYVLGAWCEWWACSLRCEATGQVCTESDGGT